MNERENSKRIKLLEETKLKESNIMDVNKMDIDVSDRRKSNFSSLGPLSASNGSISRGNSSNTKGDIRKLVIKNFKSKSSYYSSLLSMLYLFLKNIQIIMSMLKFFFLYFFQFIH